nr:thioesterase [bacterium]
MIEAAFEYPVQLVGNDFSELGMLKPVTYQNLIQQVAERHLKALHLDTEDMAACGLAWVLVGMTIEVSRAPHGMEMLKGKTWHSQQNGAYFRREFDFYGEDGQRVFCGASFSVLLDLKRRTIARHYTLPQDLGPGYPEFVLDHIRPAFREIEQYQAVEKRKVYNSFMDCLGHVNNTRYCEFAFDALTQQEKARPISRIAINFVGELRAQEEFTVYKGYQGNTVYIKGVREADGKKSFDVAFSWAQEDAG